MSSATTTTTTTTPEATIFERMLAEMQAMRAEMQRMAEAFATDQSDWANPDDACRILGVPITESLSHRRRLGKLVENGRLAQFRDGKPRMYYKPELRQVAQLVAQGIIAI